MTKDFAQRIVDDFEMDAAFSWEGGADHKIKSCSKGMMILSFDGDSMVEHDGDVQGIRDQVYDLIGKTKYVTDEYGNRFKIHIINSNVKITEGERCEDRDYTVYVKGTVTMTYKIDSEKT